MLEHAFAVQNTQQGGGGRGVLVAWKDGGFVSVSDPYSSNPDPAQNLNPDPDQKGLESGSVS